MGDFILVSKAPDDVQAQVLSDDLRRLAEAAGMIVSVVSAAAWLGLGGPCRPSLLKVGPWTLVGDVFNRQRARLPETSPGDPFEFERKLVARFWGRYVGVRFDPGGNPAALLRDPSGALDCVVWEQDGLTLAGSTIPDWLIQRLRPDWTIDFSRLAHVMRRPLLASADLMLRGVTGVLPGSIQPLPLGEPPVPVWRPIDHAYPSLDPSPPSTAEAADGLKQAIDETVSALARLPGSLASEVSGGLDSSLIAASLVQSEVPVAAWLNAYGRSAESDERPYVTALGEKLGILPRSSPHATGPLTVQWLDRISQGIRPPLNALDVHHDLDWIQRLKAAGATALMTGKGGDSILVQAVTPEVFTDLYRARGLSAAFSPDARRLASLNEVSLWTLMQGARRWRPSTRNTTAFEGLLRPLDGPRHLHPWLIDADAFGPAKGRQLAGVADSVSRHGPSLLSEQIDVRHPLCAQPVIEACLSLPVSTLTLGVRDRGLARHAFRDRLPDLIANRRSKGDMSRIYGHMILDNLDVIRPFLLEGRLVQAAILDREATEAALTREHLTWHGLYAAIMMAVAFEAWVRVWENRLGVGPKG